MSDLAARWGTTIRRKRGDTTQTDLGNRLGGVPQPLISLWENGKRLPPPDMQSRIVEVLDITDDELGAIYRGEPAEAETVEGAA